MKNRKQNGCPYCGDADHNGDADQKALCETWGRIEKERERLERPIAWEDGVLYSPEGRALIVTHEGQEIDGELMAPNSAEERYADLFRAAPYLLRAVRLMLPFIPLDGTAERDAREAAEDALREAVRGIRA